MMLKSCLKLMAGLAVSAVSVTPGGYTAIENIAASFANVKAALASQQAVSYSFEADETAVSGESLTNNEADEASVSVIEEGLAAPAAQTVFEAEEAIMTWQAPAAPSAFEDEEVITTWKAPAVKTTVETVETNEAAAPVMQESRAEAKVENAKAHSVDTSALNSGLGGAYVDAFLNTIRSGSKNLYYTGDIREAKSSLSEIVSVYCNLSSIDFYESADASGTYLELTDGAMSTLKSAVAKADADFEGYKAFVADAAASLNLNTSDKDLVDQINEYICSTFSYAVTNSSISQFTSTKVGQCWHYAKLFADLCTSVGIDAVKVETTEHAWNEVTVDGTTYSFDTTYNDTGNNWTAYSWMK